MKRSALIIADDPQFREWLGCVVSTCWPKITIEYCPSASAPLYLDSTEHDRYRLIVVQTGFRSRTEQTICIFLMRILNLELHPEIVLISDDATELERAKTTKLGMAYCLQTKQATIPTFRHIFEEITQKTAAPDGEASDGAPFIPGYVIDRSLAATYTTTVYRAYSGKHGTDVALKVSGKNSIEYESFHRLTLRQEYDVLRKLGGQYIAQVYEYGETDQLAYIALEYFPNGAINQYLRQRGHKLSRVHYLLQVARALREVHDAGFLHLDLKPDNVLIREDGSPAIIDFGISKRIVAAQHQEKQKFSLGSPYFVSPEQARGGPMDVRSDIYSFGALWFCIFTGRTPFAGRTLAELSREWEGATPSMGHVLQPYQPIVDKTLAADPDARFSSADELIENIEYYLSSATGMHQIADVREMEAQASLRVV
ncbi:MAG: serine/threonine-protein kinase [Planctomycetota bacterium]